MEYIVLSIFFCIIDHTDLLISNTKNIRVIRPVMICNNLSHCSNMESDRMVRSALCMLYYCIITFISCAKMQECK